MQNYFNIQTVKALITDSGGKVLLPNGETHYIKNWTTIDGEHFFAIGSKIYKLSFIWLRVYTMRISKKEYYALGGMANPKLYRKEINGKWYHYQLTN